LASQGPGHEIFYEQEFTKFATQHQHDRMELGRRMVYYPSSQYVILVRLHESPGAAGWIVHLENRECTCLE
jgi:hypothetical protein